MNIHFYLDNEEEMHITSMGDLASNPFKIGDEIFFDEQELYQIDYDKYGHEVKMINDNKELEFKRKKVKLVREAKYVNFKIAKKAKLTIEYHCVYLED